MKTGLTRQFKQSVRYENGLYLVFYDKDTVYVDDGTMVLRFDRWFYHERGSYPKWEKFVYRAKYGYHLSISELRSLAYRNDIRISGAKSIPKLPADVKVLSARRSHGKNY